jgi:2-polyprenyl-3-methyl-5-hydroxy-6-metoxy-1,4-benzoquinol methylase
MVWGRELSASATWNHNIEYHKVVRTALGAGPLTVLDVGCGDGVLARELSALGHQVTAIDADEPSISRARLMSQPPVDLVRGDFMSFPFERESFDAVVSVAALHHMPESEALQRMASLLRADGTLVVVGLARSRLPHDLPWHVAGAVMTRVRRLRKGGYREVTSPTVWPPPRTYREIWHVANAVLPGVRYRRHAMWRYSLVWTKNLPSHR